MLMNAKVAGIEFAGDEVRVVLVKAGGKRPTVIERHAVQAAPEGDGEEQQFEAMVNALDEALNALQTQPAAYVLCASCGYSIVRTITIPFRGRRRVAAAVQFELEPYLAFPIEELLIDYSTVAEIEGQTEVLAMGMRRAHFEHDLAILHAAGVNVEAVSLDAMGLTALWHAEQKGTKGLNAVLHVRDQCSILAITYNKRIAYFRHLPLTPEQLRESPAGAAREVQNTLRAFLAMWRGGGDIEQLHVTGLQFTEEERAGLSEALRLPVEDTLLGANTEDADHPNYWEAAAGVAHSAAGGGYTVDFKRSQQNWQGAARGLIAHVLFSACLALLALLGWAFYYYQGTLKLQAEAEAFRSRLSTINEDIESLRAQGLGEGVNVDVFADPTLLEILREIGQKMPEDKVRIDNIEIASPGAHRGWISIEGRVGNSAVFNEVYRDLKTSELFRVEDEPEISLQGSETTFEVTAYRRKPGDGGGEAGAGEEE